MGHTPGRPERLQDFSDRRSSQIYHGGEQKYGEGSSYRPEWVCVEGAGNTGGGSAGGDLAGSGTAAEAEANDNSPLGYKHKSEGNMPMPMREADRALLTFVYLHPLHVPTYTGQPFQAKYDTVSSTVRLPNASRLSTWVEWSEVW